MPLAPLFTAATAREMARRSVQARRAKRERAKADAKALQDFLAQRLEPTDDERRLSRVKAQADLLQDKIEDCIRRDDDDRLTVLTQALARLWPLAQPTAGSLKPGRQQRQARPEVQPTPQEPQP